MKRILALFLCLSICLSCSGCSTIYESRKKIEQLQVIQTMGLDYKSGAVSLSLATGFDPKALNGPARLFSDAASITAAFERIRSYSFEEELFFSHINSLLLGEEAAEEGLNSYLMYICRSPDIRIDIPVFIIKGGSAREAIINTGNAINGVSEVLSAVKQNLEWRGDGSITRTADVVQDLARYDSALICALEYTDSAEISGSVTETQDKNDRILAYVGYALIRDGRLCEYIDREDAIGIAFIKNQVRVCDIIVEDREGRRLTLEIDEGGSKIKPRWAEDGSLTGFELEAHVEASIVELDSGKLGHREDMVYVQSLLEKDISRRISAMLQLSRRYRTDFLGLSSIIEMKDAQKFRDLQTEFEQLLPQLEIQVTVRGKLRHTNDIKDEKP